MITEKKYNELKNRHELGCKTGDYSKMIMIGSKEHKQMREYEAKYICKHGATEDIMGGQIIRCIYCGKEWY